MANAIPTIIVVFGATGDLFAKKIVPALFHLFKKKKLPALFRLIGVARRPFSKQDFNDHITNIIRKHDPQADSTMIQQFITHILYHQGEFSQADSYQRLAVVMGRIDNEWKVCANKLFYLAVPPKLYETIFTHLASSGLTTPCSPEEGWTRVLVEKPFGYDAATAEKLDIQLGKLFKEEQIYRIDHYLAKEMLQNILHFRFANMLLESSWNNHFIEKIEIRLWEKAGVEGRGQFYDGLGALRDVGENHLLQMLALITMERPPAFDAASVRTKRAEILRKLRPLSNDEISRLTFRAQYEGYHDVEHVHSQSLTETYFRVQAMLDSPRWEGVPIYLESGKKLQKQIKEIVVTLKHPVPCLCPPGSDHGGNVVRFQIEPQEKIEISFLSKKPGLDTAVTEKHLRFLYRTSRQRTQYVEEYEKLLLDCIKGNQLLFTSTQEVQASWRYTDPIICAWEDDEVKLNTYHQNSNTITKEAEAFFQKGNAQMPREIGVIGLGKMGGNIALRLLEKGWNVVGYNRTQEKLASFIQSGLTPASSYQELIEKLKPPRVIWMMIPSGSAIDDVISSLVRHLEKGDIIIDAGNTYFQDTVRRGELLSEKKIRFIDVGVSGGPSGARNGACLMVGGDKKLYQYLLPLFFDLATVGGLTHIKGIGGGHFVKMIHNGIEYGIMQAIGEGFNIINQSTYHPDLKEVAHLYNHGSVIESRLIGWLEQAYQTYGQDLKGISGEVAATGEGEWTVKTARAMNIPVPVIEESVKFRQSSHKNPSYIGKVLSALRNQFGGHNVGDQRKK